MESMEGFFSFPSPAPCVRNVAAVEIRKTYSLLANVCLLIRYATQNVLFSLVRVFNIRYVFSFVEYRFIQSIRNNEAKYMCFSNYSFKNK